MKKQLETISTTLFGILIMLAGALVEPQNLPGINHLFGPETSVLVVFFGGLLASVGKSLLSGATSLPAKPVRSLEVASELAEGSVQVATTQTTVQETLTISTPAEAPDAQT